MPLDEKFREILKREMRNALRQGIPDQRIAQRNHVSFQQLDEIRAELHREAWQAQLRLGRSQAAKR